MKTLNISAYCLQHVTIRATQPFFCPLIFLPRNWSNKLQDENRMLRETIAHAEDTSQKSSPRVGVFAPDKLLQNSTMLITINCNTNTLIAMTACLINIIPHYSKNHYPPSNQSHHVATSKNDLFPGNNHLITTRADDPSL